jgi:aspartyl-tRNA(Asn)/glutamyl-tRNA(Gln) amidotransferase subunit A
MTTLPDFFKPTEVKPGQKIGLIKEFMTDDVDPQVRTRVSDYVEKLKAAGHTVEEVSLTIVQYTLAMYYIIVPAEVSSNLARYDGIRYGRRAEGAATLAELYGRTRDEGFMPENKRRIMIGSFVLSSGYFDAYYLQAQKARTLLINELNELFKTYDVLIGPVAPTPAFGLGENTADPIKMYLADVMTVPASLAGLPALSVPAGKTDQGLPVGVQLIGQRRSDANLLALAQSMEEK